MTQLRDLAQRLGIRGYSDIRKQPLVDLILNSCTGEAIAAELAR